MIRNLVLAALLLTLSGPAALAADKPELTIYTYDSFAADWGPGPQLKAAFEAKCGCTVNFVATDSSIGALRRVQLEGKSTSADIIVGLDTSVTGQARATGLFAESGVDTSGLNLPIAWDDKEFVPFDWGYFAFIYNTTKLPEPPTSFEALNAAKDLKILIEDPRADTPGLGLVLWIKAAYGDKAAGVWKAMWPHVVTMAPDWSAAYSLFLKGEADMVLSYTTSPAYHIVADNDLNYAAAPFEEGHYMQVEVAGVLKSSPNKELAQQFLTWLVTPEAQTIIPDTNWMYPVVDLPETPAGFEDLIVPDTPLLLPDDEVTAKADEWINEALDAQH